MLALMDEPAFPGCILTVGLLGAFELEKDGDQNDRYVTSLLPSAEASLSTDGYGTLSDLPKQLLSGNGNLSDDVFRRARTRCSPARPPRSGAAYKRVKASLR